MLTSVDKTVDGESRMKGLLESDSLNKIKALNKGLNKEERKNNLDKLDEAVKRLIKK